ncbi:hypothetical protein TNCV_1411571 [Trichonephila clavipes]|nr:hypothetical protein TNCV_1411571 [Trichonephila clavipes]
MLVPPLYSCHAPQGGRAPQFEKRCPMVDWGLIVFSDESRFQLFPDDHRRRVWRLPRQLAYLAFTIARHIGLQPGVMAWSVILLTTGPLWTSLEAHTVVRRRHSENCFVTVPLAAIWPHFLAR